MNDRASFLWSLLNDYQHDFPRVTRPFAAIANAAGLAEETVLDAYHEGCASGVVSRIGAVVAPRRLGASTLAAMAVPAARLDEVAHCISAHTEVNHNYEREGEWNLWFVVIAADAQARDEVLRNIGVATGLPVISMPLCEEYHIDLGFDLAGGDKLRTPVRESSPCLLDEMGRAVLAELESGLAITAQPFRQLGDRVGLSEHRVIELIDGWLASGLLKRFGVVVRHHELGFTANAMCVWDVPDDHVDALGERLAGLPGVTLCYRRQRALPHWRYNLYCMIHGKERNEVEALRTRIAEQLGLDRFDHAVLFSRRRFKQCGARYARATTAQGCSA